MTATLFAFVENLSICVQTETLRWLTDTPWLHLSYFNWFQYSQYCIFAWRRTRETYIWL